MMNRAGRGGTRKVGQAVAWRPAFPRGFSNTGSLAPEAHLSAVAGGFGKCGATRSPAHLSRYTPVPLLPLLSLTHSGFPPSPEQKMGWDETQILVECTCTNINWMWKWERKNNYLKPINRWMYCRERKKKIKPLTLKNRLGVRKKEYIDWARDKR